MTAAHPASAAEPGKTCMPIGGVAIPNFFPEGECKPIIISAALTGSVQNAVGKILAQRRTATGLEMDMEHHFGRDDGGAIQTRDPRPGTPDQGPQTRDPRPGTWVC